MTLIELLVVVLILGILLNFAVPGYLGAVKSSRAQAAMTNSRMIAYSVQTKYVKAGEIGYSTFTGATLNSDATLLADLSGKLPKNPCTGGSSLTVDYTIVAAGTKWTITPVNAPNCSAADLATIQLGK